MKTKLQTEMKPSWNSNHMPNSLKFKKLDAASTVAERKNNEFDDEIDYVIEFWEEFRSYSIHG
jgi:hypothetical protein